MTTGRFCVAGGWESTRDAEHGYHDVKELVGCCFTYVGTTFEGPARVVVTGADELVDLPEHARLFAFPGHAALAGTMTVGEVLLVSAIDEVRGLAGTVPSLDDLLDTQDFVRPRRQEGRLVLTVRPADGERFVPFEQPNPTPCCADH